MWVSGGEGGSSTFGSSQCYGREEMSMRVHWVFVVQACARPFCSLLSRTAPHLTDGKQTRQQCSRNRGFSVFDFFPLSSPQGLED